MVSIQISKFSNDDPPHSSSILPANISISRHTSKRFSPLSYSLCLPPLHFKNSREICLASNKSPHACIQSSRTSFSSKLARLPPPLFLFPPLSSTRIPRRTRLSPPTLDFLSKDERYTRRNDSATRLVHVEYTYVIPDTDYNDDTQTISLILRIHWSSLQCIIVSMMQRLRIYIYVSFAFQEAMMLINFPCTANYIAVYVRGIRVKWSE